MIVVREGERETEANKAKKVFCSAFWTWIHNEAAEGEFPASLTAFQPLKEMKNGEKFFRRSGVPKKFPSPNPMWCAINFHSAAQLIKSLLSQTSGGEQKLAKQTEKLWSWRKLLRKHGKISPFLWEIVQQQWGKLKQFMCRNEWNSYSWLFLSMKLDGVHPNAMSPSIIIKSRAVEGQIKGKS